MLEPSEIDVIKTSLAVYSDRLREMPYPPRDEDRIPEYQRRIKAGYVVSRIQAKLTEMKRALADAEY